MPPTNNLGSQEAGSGLTRPDLTVEGNQFMYRPTNPRDKAGRVLYEERMRMLPGLVQPPAPDWRNSTNPPVNAGAAMPRDPISEKEQPP